MIRQSRDGHSADVARAVAAATRAGVTPEVSRASTESDQALIDRKPWRRFGRVRIVGSIGPELRQALIDAEVDLVEEPVTSSGRLELRHYLREQAVSTTLHRFGNLVTATAFPGHAMNGPQLTAPRLAPRRSHAHDGNRTATGQRPARLVSQAPTSTTPRPTTAIASTWSSFTITPSTSATTGMR